MSCCRGLKVKSLLLPILTGNKVKMFVVFLVFLGFSGDWFHVDLKGKTGNCRFHSLVSQFLILFSSFWFFWLLYTLKDSFKYTLADDRKGGENIGSGLLKGNIFTSLKEIQAQWRLRSFCMAQLIFGGASIKKAILNQKLFKGRALQSKQKQSMESQLHMEKTCLILELAYT